MDSRELNEQSFVRACIDNDIETARLLIRRVDINRKDKSDVQRTHLHDACLRNSLEFVKFLCQHGANEFLADQKGRTALHYASSMGSTDIVEYLIKRNTHKMSIKRSQLKFTSQQRTTVSRSGKTYQLQVGGDRVLAQTRYGESHVISYPFSFNERDYEEDSIIEVETNDYVNCVDKENRTPLHYACGEDIGWCCLHYSCAKGYSSIVSLLLSQPSCKIDVVNDAQNTPLYYAIRSCNEDIVKQLLNFDSKIELTEKDWHDLNWLCKYWPVSIQQNLLLRFDYYLDCILCYVRLRTKITSQNTIRSLLENLLIPSTLVTIQAQNSTSEKQRELNEGKLFKLLSIVLRSEHIPGSRLWASYILQLLTSKPQVFLQHENKFQELLLKHAINPLSLKEIMRIKIRQNLRVFDSNTLDKVNIQSNMLKRYITFE
ncbi:unnamed protein product [Didymodactylos carnosus]|uniref:Uncharacterized protein n=1 Tax=Didymodactylos carnosus TaxID=1234261 RepID=A0A814KUL0_9BILA|nr:unnamed protein product [Didymodactylos carnosus]CAF3824613.1 unnamed protein product [Didymodactylos carnosus]